MDSHSLKDKDKDHKHKSKKRSRHGHGDADDKRKHKKRKDKEAVVRVVDDDLDGEDMWVEKNVDMDGEKARNALQIFGMALSNVHIKANCSRYTHGGEPQVDFACLLQARGPVSSQGRCSRVLTETRRLDACAFNILC